MQNNHFETLSAALEAVRQGLASEGHVLANESELFDVFCFGGVNYSDTKTATALLASYKGKPISGRMAKRGVCLSIYRMQGGTYEAVAYAN